MYLTRTGIRSRSSIKASDVITVRVMRDGVMQDEITPK